LNDDRVIVVSPGFTTVDRRELVVIGTDWDTTYDTTANFTPGDAGQKHMISTGLTMLAAH
jgi:hypothetical protein